MPATQRLCNVQCLRALAALLVVAVHEPRLEAHQFGASWIGWLTVPGGTGVDLFFVISGFIMVTTMWNAFGAPGAAGSFLVRRIERIYPIYWLVTTAYLVLHVALPAAVGLAPATPLDVVASYLLVPHGAYPVLVVGWTLQYELAFYLVFTCALCFPRRALPVVLGGWALAALACGAAAAHTPSVALSFLGNPLIFEFLLGAGVGAAAASRRLAAPLALLLAGVAGAAAVFAYVAPLPALPSPWFRALVVAPPMALILAGAVGLELRRGWTGPAWLGRIGDASYSLYLSHGLVLGAVAAVAARLPRGGPPAHAAFVLASYGAVIAVSLGLYRWVERPLLRRLRRPQRGGPTGRSSPVPAAPAVRPQPGSPAPGPG